MACDRVRARLTAYLDGELDGDHGTVVRGHLRTCEDCRRIAEDEAVLRDGLRGLPTLDPPASLWAGVQARLAAEEVAEAARPAWRRTLARWGRFVSAPRLTGGVLVGAAAVTVVWWKTQREPEHEAIASDRVVPAPVIDNGRTELKAAATPTPSDRDVTDELRAEPARMAASYQQTIDELLAVADDMRSGWSDDHEAAFDAKVKSLSDEITNAADGKPKRRAYSALIDYLQGALIREDVLLASVGGR